MAGLHVLRNGKSYGKPAVHGSTAAGQKRTPTKKKPVKPKPRPKPHPKIPKGKPDSHGSARKPKGRPYSGLRRQGLRGEPLVCLKDIKAFFKETFTALDKEFQDVDALIKAWNSRVIITRKRVLRDRHYKYNIRLSWRARTTFKYRGKNGKTEAFNLADDIRNIDDWRYFCKLLCIPQRTVDAWDTELSGCSEECWKETMRTWLDEKIMTRYPVSWVGMIDLLNDSTCPRLSAHNLRHALHLVPSQAK